MWKLEIYPSLLEGAPIERHDCEGSLGAWLDACEIKWREEEEQPIIVSLNSLAYPVSEWDKELPVGAVLKIRVIPRKSIFKFIGKIFKAIMKLFGVKTPKAMANNSQNQKSLEAADVSANTAKLGEIVPELAGTYRKYPDYLVNPHRYFVADDPRTQVVEFHACIGPGFYNIPTDSVKLGNTPFNEIGEGRGLYSIYQPGDSLVGVSTNENWYPAPEVGSTSSGTSGIELNSTIKSIDNPPATKYTIGPDGKSITRTGGSWPELWDTDTIIDIIPVHTYSTTPVYIPFPYYEVLAKATGDFNHLMPMWAGNATNTVGRDQTTLEIHLVEPFTSYEIIRPEVIDFSITGSPSDYITTAASATNSSNIDVGIGLASAKYRILTKTGDTLTFERVLQDYYGDAYNLALWITDNSFVGFTPGDLDTRSLVNVIFVPVMGGSSATFVATPQGELTKKLELDFFFPSGLSYVDGDGNPQWYSVSLDVTIKSDTGYLETRKIVYSNHTVDQIGYTEVFEFATPIRPSVRVRRFTATGTSSQINDKVVWYGLKSLLTNRDSYPNWTTIGVKMRSGGKLGQGSENQINVLATRLLPTIDNGVLGVTNLPSREISSFFTYIAQTAGYDLAQLDMVELGRLEQIWRARGDTFNYVFDETTVKDALDLTLNAGFAETTVEDGILKPVRNVARTQFEQAYSPQNMVGQLVRKFQAPAPDDADGVEVDYMDERTWTRKTLVCALPGSDKARLEKIKVEGVTDRARAWRLGMRRMYELMYRRWSYSFSTELDGMCSNYLSYVPLFDDLPEYQQSALAAGIVSGIFSGIGLGYKVTLTEPIKWSEFVGGTITVAFRSRTGKISPYFTCRPITGPTVSEYQFGIGNIDFFPFKDWLQTLSGLTNAERSSGNIDINLGEPLHAYIGRTDRFCFPALITAVKPGDNNEVNIDAVNYDARIYQADDSLPPSDI